MYKSTPLYGCCWDLYVETPLGGGTNYCGIYIMYDVWVSASSITSNILIIIIIIIIALLKIDTPVMLGSMCFTNNVIHL